MRNNRKQAPSHLSWSYCASLADGERHSLLTKLPRSWGLFTCRLSFQKAHAALNESLRLNRLFSHQSETIYEKYQKESNMRLHDLREIWLRVMQDCRN